jgi:hypothetical protein
VTWDESQVSVGGILALDQVLRSLGHVLGLRQAVEGRAQDEAKIAGSRPLFGFWDYVTDIGMSAHGFTHA